MANPLTVVSFLLSLWLFESARRRLFLVKHRRERERVLGRKVMALEKLHAARKNTVEKYKRVWEALQMNGATERTRRLVMMTALRSRRSRPSVWSCNRASQWWDDVVPGFTAAQWLENFRMSEQTFIYLCSKLRPALERQHTSFRRCVPLNKRVAIALWKLATGSEYRSIGHLFGVSITTVWRCVKEFCAAAETLLVPEQIRIPDETKFRDMSAYIENRWGLPHCVGAIHGSHIPIIAPPEYHTDYFNHNGWNSMILQGVVDGKGLFWNVCTGLAGSLHDARVLRLSTLWELASRGNLFPPHSRNIENVETGYYILGDSAYPLLNWLLKPFNDTGRLTAAQLLYNNKLSRARVVMENAFGRLKGRWRCLLKRNDCDLELVQSMALNCCALHNLCESQGEPYESTWDEAADFSAVQSATVAQNVEEGGRDLRDAVMHLCDRN